MPGLNLGLGARGHVGVTGVGSGFSSPQASPSSASQMAYGPMYSDAMPTSRKAALTPNDAFGVAFWWGVGSLGLLMLIRHSLPA